MSRLSRRSVLIGLSGVASAGTLKHARAQQTNPIKIAMPLELSGPGQLLGHTARVGAEITADLINKNGGVLGRPIALTFFEQLSTPDGAVAAVRQAASEGFNLLSGTILSPTILAEIPMLSETKSILITGAGIAMSFTHERYSRNLFRANDNDYERARVLARLAAQKFPDLVNFVGVCSDSQSYIESYTNFVKFAKNEYAAIGKSPTFADPVVSKFGSTEFRSQLSALSTTPNVGVYNMMVGNDGITFWQQARPFPFIKNIRVVLDQNIDVTGAKALKTNVPPNCWTFMFWYYGMHMNNPFSKAFYDEYVRRTQDRYPGAFTAFGHFGIASYAAAIKAANGATDTDTVIKMLETVSIDTIKGPITYRKEDHQMLGEIDVAEFEGSTEDPGFKVVDTATFHSADVVEPPSPGQAFKI